MSSIYPVKIEDNALCCPKCGGDYIHLGRVEVYRRSGEDGPSTRFRVDACDKATRTENATGNPSSRRDGLQFWVWCELCHGESVISVREHKGNIFVEAREGAE